MEQYTICIQKVLKAGKRKLSWLHQTWNMACKTSAKTLDTSPEMLLISVRQFSRAWKHPFSLPLPLIMLYFLLGSVFHTHIFYFTVQELYRCQSIRRIWFKSRNISLLCLTDGLDTLCVNWVFSMREWIWFKLLHVVGFHLSHFKPLLYKNSKPFLVQFWWSYL